MEYLTIYLNFFILGIILIYYFRLKIISKNILILLLITNIAPIIINFDDAIYNKFPDQGGYYDNLVLIRKYFDHDNLRHKFESQFLASMLQIIPIPFLYNVADASYINRFLLCFFFIYLIKNNYLKNNQIIILILYPSLILYSSLFLKETLIIILICYSYIKLKEKKFSLSFFSLFLVTLIKPYLAIAFFATYIIYIMINFQILNFLKFVILSTCLYFYIYPELLFKALDYVNLQIYNFNSESLYYSKEVDLERNKLSIDFNLIIYILDAIFDFWFRPILYEANRKVEIFQSIENIIIFILFVYLLSKIYQKSYSKFYYLICSIIFISLPYSLIVENIGTLSRYRFTILAIFLIIIFYELNLKKKKNEIL